MLFPFHAFSFIDGLGMPEMVVIGMIVLVLFGPDKLPGFARGLGKSIREFKKAAAGVEEEFKRAIEEDEIKKIIPKISLEPSTPEAALPPAATPENAEITDITATPAISADPVAAIESSAAVPAPPAEADLGVAPPLPSTPPSVPMSVTRQRGRADV
jgi:sec-independent protein translocase protein TatA